VRCSQGSGGCAHRPTTPQTQAGDAAEGTILLGEGPEEGLRLEALARQLPLNEERMQVRSMDPRAD
jgi:hypothetical protein